jgi:DNA-binding NarL/FixJ family response regulator
MTIRIVIADDQELLRAGFRVLLTSDPDLSVAGEARTGTEAVDLARRLQPDVVIMDIRMPVMDGIEATRHISASADTAAVRVLILTTFDLDEYVYSALRAGASGFLLKDAPPGDLLTAVRVIASGDALLGPSITRRLITEFADRPAANPAARHDGEGLEGITGREREVLALVGQGLSNTEIAGQLHISPHTAKTHVGRLLYKLDARDRVHLVILAHRAGLAASTLALRDPRAARRP